MEYDLLYTDKIPEKFGGITITCSPFAKYILRKKPIIKIRPKYISDIGLLNHEVKHVEQCNREWFYNLRYRFIKSYRYRMELEAYTEQIKAYKYKSIGEVKWIINALLNKYNLKISEEKITYDIKNILINNLFDKNQ